MYRVILFSDSRYRDSFGSSLVKYYLDTKYSNTLTQVASFNYWQQALNTFAPHVVVLNHMQGERSKIIARHVKNNGGKVIVQFNEGLLEFANKRPIFEMQKGSELVDLFLCWNKETADLVDGVVIGNPRFDIYGKYKDLILSQAYMKSVFRIPQEKKVIVFGSSFPSSKFTYMLQSFHKSNWKELGNTLAKEWEDPEEFAKNQAMYQKQFKSAILTAALALPPDEWQVTMAPHPMSDINMWREFCEEYAVTMLHGYYIHDILSMADVYVGKLGSVTIGESWLMNKRTIKFQAGYLTASSEEQLYGDELKGDTNTRVMETNLNYPGIESDSIAPYILNAIKSGVRDHTEYLKKWGIYPTNAGEKTADMIADVINKSQPQLLSESGLDIVAYTSIVENHDTYHLHYRIDGYGNHNKAVRQVDIDKWLKLIRKANA